MTEKKPEMRKETWGHGCEPCGAWGVISTPELPVMSGAVCLR